MIAASLLDILARDGGFGPGAGPQEAARASEVVGRFVESALADWQHVLDCEQQIGSTTFANPGTEGEADRSLFEAYQRWAAETEHVLARTRQLAAGGHPVEGADALEHAYGRVRARLKLAPAAVERAAAQARHGEGVPMKELRDELRARVRA